MIWDYLLFVFDDMSMNEKEYKLSFKNQLRTMASLTVYRTGRQQCAPLESRGQEIREFYLIHLVIKGRGTFILNNRSFPVETGDAFLIYPNMPINYIADEEDPWEFWWVGFNGTDAGFLLGATRFSIRNPVISLSDPDEMRDLLADIYAMRGNLPHETIRMSAGLYSLLSYLIKDNENILGQKQEHGAAQFHRACDFIAEHYGDPISVVDIAGALGISRSRLYRIFMEQISMPPQNYLTEFRIRRACILLASTEKIIKEISFEVGFKDQMYFSTVFRSVIGMTPTEFRLRESRQAGQDNIPDKGTLRSLNRDTWRRQE